MLTVSGDNDPRQQTGIEQVTDIPTQDTPHYKDDSQHGKNNVGLEPAELESLRAKQQAGTLTPSEKNKLKANEKKAGQRRSRQSKDKK